MASRAITRASLGLLCARGGGLRALSSGAGAKPPELELHVYQAAASRTLQCLQEKMEAMVDESDDDSDVDFSGDVLNLTIGDRGTFVLNKQEPNKQIWLSSPVSGPLRYDLDVEALDWVNTRDRSLLSAVLGRDISQLVGREVAFDVNGAVAEALRAARPPS